MKQQSKLFDNIRIRPRREEKLEPVEIQCDWEGCEAPGEFKAPKGVRSEGQYHNFCLEHVRHYNKAFNYFAGMSPDELDEALHAPPKAESRSTFATGNPGTARAAGRSAAQPGDKYGDPFGVFARYRYQQSKRPAAERVKPLNEPDRRALETLGILGHAKSDEIKAAYKGLVKKHHPDVNGGDASSEERLRTVIAAYTHLKKMGFVTR
ncbi:DnaJ domain-containing protein [Devosia sp. XJ19-1]|uniref:DnaJ domain-containing protein n=1 Tax=Devosia ureilytica TaxID=2952754 RepID=A0A9Q4FUL5_9HYPH|nr:DnaJ domain-containing protein [Devosia ureilytica]MCP8885371.1 DnaJ domain-containing protein [Devosia ureilytica]MCP8888953.1 DnaJ domain-containing protein [Devosia ureilytica]